ncbi:hypothetical protein LTR70_007864 [Exophiala xenobiotica]|uniref:Altered inheritance of mitochondria protein 11 n=1 Tax=Lithohypha guttulata TaxID=1690604 RepID=A0ABR0K2I2_9EURO|nr:hypothetical protein LTR24_007536 [Lithohypha guttulata]KAK5312947.1 hypothetical protein LTR70_007864 [Exophiala xenobiotica]
MSWFSSLFSGIKFPPPADSIRPHEKRLLEEPSASTQAAEPATPASHNVLSSPDNAAIQEQGRRRNKLIFAAGLAFFGLSVLTTRRSLARRSDAPAHNVEQSKNVSGALEAVEALNLATLNVLSVAMTATGGALWYLDLNSLADARKMIRGGLGVDGKGMTEQEADEEIEEAIASILARKDAKGEKK